MGSLSAGAGWFYSNPDFGQRNIQGMIFYSDFDISRHFGAEGEIHYSVLTPTNVSENLYVAGPRYVFRQNRFEEYAKLLFGAGHFGLQIGGTTVPQTNVYFAYVAGFGVDVHATRHVNVRAFDFEIQKWPGFPQNGLSPMSGSVGAAYVFH